ncbi:MAG: hypothetical protein ACODAD_01345 [Planctomycetota bacterium]
MTSGDSNQELPHLRAGPPGSKPAHLLLIDDDGGRRDMLADAFRRQVWKVTECVNGLRWLYSCVHEASCPQPAEYAESDLHNVGASNVRMPNLSGLEVIGILCPGRCLDVCSPRMRGAIPVVP